MFMIASRFAAVRLARRAAKACWVAALAAALLGSLAGGAAAEEWPARPVKFLVPLAAGSTADILSRMIGERLTKVLGQPFVVDNKPGAGGTIAMAEVARAPADGYTIAFASQGTLVFNQALYSKPGYDSLKDFAPISYFGGVSNVMIVPPTSTAKSPLDIIAQAKAKPGKLNFSSGGSGTSHHLSGVLFGQLAKVNIQHVPYKGAPQGIMAVMTGEVDMGFFNTPTVISQIRSGKLKALAVTSLTRSELLPDVPTLDASGVPGYEMNTWLGFIAPAGTPKAIITRLNAEIGRFVQDSASRKKLVELGFDLAPVAGPEALSKLIRDDMEKWIPLVKASGAHVD